MKNLKHYIGIPYFNKERKLIGTRKRGTNKDFKWNQNSKLWLYGIQNIEKIRQQEYVVLVEGESDTHTLSYYNIPVLGVPGASTFNSSMTLFHIAVKSFCLFICSSDGSFTPTEQHSILYTSPLYYSRIKSLESNEEKIEITYYIDKKWHFAIYPLTIHPTGIFG